MHDIAPIIAFNISDDYERRRRQKLPDTLTIAAFIASIVLGQAMLSASLLAMRARYREVYLPFALFFVALSMSELSSIMEAPALQTLPRQVLHLVAAASFPTDLLLLPAFWFYVRALTAERELVWSRQDLIHFIPAIVGLITFAMIVLTPDADRTALFDTGRDRSSTLQTGLFFLIIGLYVTWLCQWIFYALTILRRLVTYRTRLKTLFASTDHLELRWVGWLGILILVNWAWVVTVFIVDSFTAMTAVEEPWLSLLDLALVWTLSVWGLRQTPGLAAEIAEAEKVEIARSRYEKSSLDEAQITRLAAKIEGAMQDDKLYRDPGLSLSRLAKEIGARPNYVSQTLNMRLEATFFDYVNKWRVEDAKAQLEASSDTVLSIAYDVGFNTRSSFYTAFKRFAGATPSVWRKIHSGQ